MLSVMTCTKPVVLLFQNDYERIKDWVLQYPNSETGGQFFGLWTQNKNPYVNVVIGPGVYCRHETHSFHQDIEYLKKVGNFLNKEFMMCHIGEWHSHHRLRLRQPSGGDLNSIWKHFPSGVEHFLLVIATIESEEVKLWPWLFTASSHTHSAIDVKVIEKNNVFMIDEAVANQTASGAEVRKVKPSKIERSSPSQDSLWFESSSGAAFVQHLHSELDKFINNESDIDKILRSRYLEFSFLHHQIRWVLRFPPDFPRQNLIIERGNTVIVPRANRKHAKGHSYEYQVDQVIETLRKHCFSCSKRNK